MTFFLLLLACTIVSCKQKSETVDIEKIELECENHGDLYDSCIYFDTTSDWERTWIQLTPLDSIERVICRHKGYVELDDTSFVVQIPDVLRYCPEKAMDYPFSEIIDSMDMSILTSDDRHMRVLFWNTGLGGSSPDIARYTLFKADDGTVHFGGEPHDNYQLTNLYTLQTSSGENLYLLHEYYRASSSFGTDWLWACRISDYSIDTLAIFPHGETFLGMTDYSSGSWYFTTNNGEGWEWLFELYENKMYIPVTKSYGLTDRYTLYQWNGSCFDSIGNVGNHRLHSSLQHYSELANYFVTKGFRIRVDMMQDSTFRYASWPRSKATSSKPDLILYNGHYDENQKCYVFENEEYTYKVGDISYAYSSDDNLLNGVAVVKDGKQILYQERERE